MPTTCSAFWTSQPRAARSTSARASNPASHQAGCAARAFAAIAATSAAPSSGTVASVSPVAGFSTAIPSTPGASAGASNVSLIGRDSTSTGRIGAACGPRSSLTSTSARPLKPTFSRRPEAFGALADAVEGVDRLVLLGDVLEFRDRPFTEAMDLAKPTLAKLAALSAGEVIVVPGNHDYRLISSWLEARALRGARPLRLVEKARLDLWPASELRAAMPGAKLKINYPGVWLRNDVYATHGHYLDRHLTIPTFERLGLALVERTLGLAPTGRRPARAAGRGVLGRAGGVRAGGRARLRLPLRARPGGRKHEPPGRHPDEADLGFPDRRRQPLGQAARVAPRLGRASRRGRASRTAWDWGRCAPTSRPTRSRAPESTR